MVTDALLQVMKSPTAQEVIAEIESAFAGETPPGDDRLLHPDCMDDVDVREFYGGLRREDMSDAFIVRNYSALYGFSPEAFRYYLPAFMTWTLRNPDSPEIAGESLLFNLDPAAVSEDLRAFVASKFVLLSGPQIEAVRHFLRFMSQHPGLGAMADRALANHWNRTAQGGGNAP